MNLKYYKLVLEKNSAGLVYPTGYQSQVGDYAKDHLYYDENDKTVLLLVLPDTVKNVVRDGVTEVTEAEAKAISEANETRTEKITDTAKIERIKIKISLGQALTADEIAALDPSSPVSGFGTTKILADRIDELKLI